MSEATASTSAAPAAPSLPLRTFKLSPPKHNPTAEGPTVALGRVGDMFCLVHSSPPESDLTPPVWMNLSVLAHEDPFPGRNMNGQEMFWLKNYSENEGILDQLVEAGIVRITGRTLKQGFVDLPMVELQLAESEISHQCPHCERFEMEGEEPRFGKCMKCKKRYYCSREHQVADWTEGGHKKICKLLQQDRRAEVENLNRREIAEWFGGSS